MNSRFSYCLKFVLGEEGGLSNHEADRGGHTNFGVTQHTYDAYRSECRLTARSVADIERDEVDEIYMKYWRDAKCDYWPEPVDLITFDMAINSGSSRAIKTLQHVLGVEADGLIGLQTINAVHEEIAAGRTQELAKDMIAERREFYRRIVAKDSSQEVFFGGWMNRLDHLETVLV